MIAGEVSTSALDIGSGGRGLLAEEGIDSVAFDVVQKPSVTLIASAEHVPFKSSAFNLIYVGEVIEHLALPFTALSEWTRVLKPGGTLIVSTPNGILVRIEGNLPQHRFTFSSRGLAASLGKLGMTVTETRTIFSGLIGKRIFDFLPNRTKMWILRLPIPSIIAYDIILKSKKDS